MTDGAFQSREQYYAGVADARARAFYRDPVIEPGAHGRADVANGPMSKWLRFNRAEDLVWVTVPEGVPRALTSKQLAVYFVIRDIAGTGQRVTMRALGVQLGSAPSTVYRAVIKLTALGFVAYQSNRGRLGGSVFLLRSAGDGLSWCRDVARAAVRRWRLAAEARISRLRGNVASCFPGRERELYEHRYSTDTVTVIGRNKYPEWTPEDFREAGLM